MSSNDQYSLDNSARLHSAGKRPAKEMEADYSKVRLLQWTSGDLRVETFREEIGSLNKTIKGLQNEVRRGKEEAVRERITITERAEAARRQLLLEKHAAESQVQQLDYELKHVQNLYQLTGSTAESLRRELEYMKATERLWREENSRLSQCLRDLQEQNDCLVGKNERLEKSPAKLDSLSTIALLDETFEDFMRRVSERHMEISKEIIQDSLTKFVECLERLEEHEGPEDSQVFEVAENDESISVASWTNLNTVISQNAWEEKEIGEENGYEGDEEGERKEDEEEEKEEGEEGEEDEEGEEEA